MIGVILTSVLAVAANAQNITVQKDPGMLTEPRTYGPTPELVHLYYDYWPTGMSRQTMCADVGGD